MESDSTYSAVARNDKWAFFSKYESKIIISEAEKDA